MSATGLQVLTKAQEHLGEEYVLGAVAALNDPYHQGPWDCSLFASWCVYQVSGIVYGCVGSQNPSKADPYTGAWYEDAQDIGIVISIDRASKTPGACLLRTGQRIGHIVISDGAGGTVEAMGSAYGVCTGKVSGRRWDFGILVPGIQYQESGAGSSPAKPKGTVYRQTYPPMAGEGVKEIQRALLRAGFNPIDLDGIYGSKTTNAVIQFQRAKGLLVDGEVGPQTLMALGIR